MTYSKVWYITGASQGLGLSLVKKLLENGYRVAATSRNAQKLKEAVGLIDSERFLPLAVDLNNPDCIYESILQTIDAFGTINVVVNNAGYGLIGAVEGISEKEIRKIFEVNVFSAISVVKSVLPFMRKQQSGHIFNIGSVAGFAGAPGWAIYSATKAAIASFSEVLAEDVKEFGIRVTVVEPSGFRTGFLTKDSLADIDAGTEEYTKIKSVRERYLAGNGNQPGNPSKASSILIDVSETNQPPYHLYLGMDAYSRASAKLSSMSEEIENWKTTTLSADY